MPAIEHLIAHEILDSRGRPTLWARCTLAGGATASVSVPSGASTGAAEAHELRDGDPARYGGLGCRRAAANVTDIIFPAVRDRVFATQAAFDAVLLELDGTPNKANLGANALLAASLAFARAVAVDRKQPLYARFAEILGEQGKGGPVTFADPTSPDRKPFQRRQTRRWSGVDPGCPGRARRGHHRGRGDGRRRGGLCGCRGPLPGAVRHAPIGRGRGRPGPGLSRRRGDAGRRRHRDRASRVRSGPGCRPVCRRRLKPLLYGRPVSSWPGAARQPGHDRPSGRSRRLARSLSDRQRRGWPGRGRLGTLARAAQRHAGPRTYPGRRLPLHPARQDRAGNCRRAQPMPFCSRSIRSAP